MNKILAINIVDAFCNTFVAALLPLLLAERGYSAAQVGLVFALMPLSFMVVRLALAATADQLTFKPFFCLNAAASAVAYALYALPFGAVGYNAGRIMDGTAQAAIWAVNRSAAIAQRGAATATHASATLIQYRQVALAGGALAAGAVATLATLPNAILFAALLEAATLAIALRLPSPPHKRVVFKQALASLDLRSKTRLLHKTALIMALRVCSLSLAFSFTLPLFLKAEGNALFSIGLLLALYYSVQVLSINYFKKRGVIKLHYSLAAITIFSTGVALLVLAPQLPLFLPLVLMAIGDGFAAFVWEALIANATEKSATISSDIGLIHIPANIAQAIALVAAGVIVSNYGYSPSFVLAIPFFILFLLTANQALGVTSGSGIARRIRYSI